jgi:hypothetical protein
MRRRRIKLRTLSRAISAGILSVAISDASAQETPLTRPLTCDDLHKLINAADTRFHAMEGQVVVSGGAYKAPVLFGSSACYVLHMGPRDSYACDWLNMSPLVMENSYHTLGSWVARCVVPVQTSTRETDRIVKSVRYILSRTAHVDVSVEVSERRNPDGKTKLELSVNRDSF